MTTYKAVAESNNFIVLDKYTKEWKVAENFQSEADLERELIQDLSNQGYEYVPPGVEIVTIREAENDQ